MRGRRLERALLWRYLRFQGFEYCSLWRGSQPDGGWAIRGTAVAEIEGRPVEARYRVICDAGWRTMTAHVGVVSSEQKRALRLRAEHGRWFGDGEEVPGFAGCIDIDLGLGASTNTLPIRRFGLEVGEARDLTAAWVRFPDLSLQPLPQRYTRLSDGLYRYESVGTGFTADLEVDDLGLVTIYPGWCERVP